MIFLGHQNSARHSHACQLFPVRHTIFIQITFSFNLDNLGYLSIASENNIRIGTLDLEIFRLPRVNMNLFIWSGVGSLIKNYIMFDNPSDYHDDACADLAKLWELPMVEGKTRLNVLCCLTPQFHGRGPHHFSRRYVWNYNGILVSQDPVSVDTVGLELIKAKRRQVLGKARELPPVPKHIKLADTKHGIGVGDLNRIELIKLGWQQDILI